MPVIETVLIYGVIPLAVVLVFAVLTLIPGRGKDKTRYRPGQPWPHDPIWYEPHPEAAGVHGADDGHGGTGSHAALPGPGATAAALAIGERPHRTAQYGALDHTDDHATGPRRTAAGGARGTW
jgi:hypothetical protein